MKTVVNGNEAICKQCSNVGAVITDFGVACPQCGSKDLLNPLGGEFSPLFGHDSENVYQINKYTKIMPDRRKSNRLWPKFKERRACNVE